MIDARNALKDMLSAVTWTDKNGEVQNVNIYMEEDLDVSRKARYVTPALLIRGQSTFPQPANVGWDEWVDTTEVTVSLYLKLRGGQYDANTVLESITNQIEALSRDNKEGIGGADYLKLTSVDDRGGFEEVGNLRRDFTFELYGASWW